MCGGTAAVLDQIAHHLGLSPRVRGNLAAVQQPPVPLRSIPACAGEPVPENLALPDPQVYPRVCGGTTARCALPRPRNGLSPRVRGNLQLRISAIAGCRSIPACAGEPRAPEEGGAEVGVYPRVCGGTPSHRRISGCRRGLSPRVRGNLPAVVVRDERLGSIPACAGEPRPARQCSRRRQVYPRVCGGTSRQSGASQGEQGLSPRVRGNPGVKGCPTAIIGSIPACAGEPMSTSSKSIQSGVYPRVCGGTAIPGFRLTAFKGLSPRVRGNLEAGKPADSLGGSIPACAGEPLDCGECAECREVYPRVCGGTNDIGGKIRGAVGLSPRVRGNPGSTNQEEEMPGSIPACAGEPVEGRCRRVWRWVYPRVCGGTAFAICARLLARGLSPRVRGNPGGPGPDLAREGSIPACAGEPRMFGPLTRAGWVYPRVCGGTPAARYARALEFGLSPRVRGNRLRLAKWPTPSRSIPACAGEPLRLRLAKWPTPVYPRVCGGTPWPFDNASCYLIRRGNNGDPLAVTYQIHPSASTVSFGRFPQRQYPPHARRRRRPGHWL